MKAALAWLGFVVGASLFAPFFLWEPGQRMDFSAVLAAPSTSHFLGTDALGRDLLSRLAVAASVSIGIGVSAVLCSLLIGVAVGVAAGTCGGWVDRLLMKAVDVMLCFPAFFLILAVVAVLGPGIAHVVLILGVTGWMGTARMVRAEILSLKERDFILAAKALGASPWRVIFRHLLPNAFGAVAVNAVLGFSAAVLAEGALSFLGVGVQPPVPSLGNLLMDGKELLGAAWWVSFFPGLVLFFTVLALHAAADRLSERMRGEKALEYS